MLNEAKNYKEYKYYLSSCVKGYPRCRADYSGSIISALPSGLGIKGNPCCSGTDPINIYCVGKNQRTSTLLETKVGSFFSILVAEKTACQEK